ncbi:MAG: hypothetical protein ACU84Q_15665, partial [Gammaproteobacteria bacterium]
MRYSNSNTPAVFSKLFFILAFCAGSANAGAVVLAESTFDPGTGTDGWSGVECTNPGLCPVFGEVGALAPGDFFHN